MTLSSLIRPRKKSATEKISQCAKDQVWRLASLAAEDSYEAAVELHGTATLVTEFLTHLCRTKPELFSGIAQNRFSWPLMYNPHPEAVRGTAAFAKLIKLGTKTGINLSSGKTFSWQVPANVVALNLHQLAESLRQSPMISWTLREWHPVFACGVGWSGKNPVHHAYNEKYKKQLRALEDWGQQGPGKQLPPLSKETAAQWARATGPFFRIVYGDNFEEHPNLKKLKRSVSLGARDASGKDTGPGVIRAKMLKAVKQSWRSIAQLA